MDLHRVNLVANLDLPLDAATYMHRVGRTGRFGSYGIAVTFVSAVELKLLQGYLHDIAGGQVVPLTHLRMFPRAMQLSSALQVIT